MMQYVLNHPTLLTLAVYASRIYSFFRNLIFKDSTKNPRFIACYAYILAKGATQGKIITKIELNIARLTDPELGGDISTDTITYELRNLLYLYPEEDIPSYFVEIEYEWQGSRYVTQASSEYIEDSNWIRSVWSRNRELSYPVRERFFEVTLERENGEKIDVTDVINMYHEPDTEREPDYSLIPFSVIFSGVISAGDKLKLTFDELEEESMTREIMAL